MHVNRGLVFWGVALITAGAVALAIQAGAIAGDTARQAWRFWPVVLIVIGLAVIASRTPFALAVTVAAGLVVGGLVGSLVAGWPDGISVGCGGEPSETLTQAGELASGASVEIDFNCGELDVSTAEGTGWSLEARHASGAEPNVTSSDESLRIEAPNGGFGFADARQEWSLDLPSDGDLEVDISANASSSTLDLAQASFARVALDANAGEVDLALDGAQIGDVSVNANAGSIQVSVNAETQADASFSMNAGSLELCADDDVALEITIEDSNITFSHNLDDGGLTRTGDTWRSGEGEASVQVRLDGNAASFTLNPDGGCS